VTVTALILEAGRSRRVGFPKAFLTLGGGPLLAGILRTALDAGVEAAVIVAGADDDPTLVSVRDVRRLLAGLGASTSTRVRIIVGRPDREPIDSIRAGLCLVGPESSVLLWPVDYPFASVSLVETMLRALAHDPGHIVRPVCGGRGAHPVLFSSTVATELTSAIADHGAHGVVDRDPTRIIEIATTDVRLVAALNTPVEARALGVALPLG